MRREMGKETAQGKRKRREGTYGTSTLVAVAVAMVVSISKGENGQKEMKEFVASEPYPTLRYTGYNEGSICRQYRTDIIIIGSGGPLEAIPTWFLQGRQNQAGDTKKTQRATRLPACLPAFPARTGPHCGDKNSRRRSHSTTPPCVGDGLDWDGWTTDER
uniref:Uncharacterized protein n=1 Tax=Anopheles farauti TaxID=69004 RepID=A0A182QEV7_9DIPT